MPCMRVATGGDPLSPMLFLLVMEVLNALIRTVDEWNLVEKFRVYAIPYWTAMYALHQAE
jgi:hypothetical protein